MHEERCLARDRPAEHVGPDGEKGFRQRRRSSSEAPRARAGTAQVVRHAVFRIAAARDQRADLLALLPAAIRSRRPMRRCRRSSSPGMSDAPGGRRILPFALHRVGRLTPAAATLMSTSFSPRDGDGPFAQFQGFGAAGFRYLDRAHGFSPLLPAEKAFGRVRSSLAIDAVVDPHRTRHSSADEKAHAQADQPQEHVVQRR